MIEIILIILISNRIAGIAEEKGYSKGLWRFFAILSWVICEFIGAIIGFIVMGLDAGFIVYIFAIIGAILGVFIVKKIIDGKPNLSNDDIGVIEY